MKIPLNTILGKTSEPVVAPTPTPTPAPVVNNATPVFDTNIPIANATGRCISACLVNFFSNCQKLVANDMAVCLQNCVDGFSKSLTTANSSVKSVSFSNSTYTTTSNCIFACTDCSTTNLNSTGECVATCAAAFLNNLINQTNVTAVVNKTKQTSECLSNCTANYFISTGYSNKGINMSASSRCLSQCISEFAVQAITANNATKTASCVTACISTFVFNSLL